VTRKPFAQFMRRYRIAGTIGMASSARLQPLSERAGGTPAVCIDVHRCRATRVGRKSILSWLRGDCGLQLRISPRWGSDGWQRALSGRQSIASVTWSMAKEMVSPGSELGARNFSGRRTAGIATLLIAASERFRTFILAYEDGDGVVRTGGMAEAGKAWGLPIGRTVASPITGERIFSTDRASHIRQTICHDPSSIEGSYQLNRYTDDDDSPRRRQAWYCINEAGNKGRDQQEGTRTDSSAR